MKSIATTERLFVKFLNLLHHLSDFCAVYEDIIHSELRFFKLTSFLLVILKVST